MRHSAVVAMYMVAWPAHAATTAPIDQPFCTTSRSLHEYLLALAKRNGDQRFEIEGCAVLKGGVEIEVIEKGRVVDGMHVDRVRITGSGASLSGWTLNFDEPSAPKCIIRADEAAVQIPHGQTFDL